jgi:nucleotide-binding universal stress UspA family protein
MQTPKVILAPVDFSGHSNGAANDAADLAAQFGSQLLLVHVVPALPKLPSASAFFHEAEFEQELHKEAKQQLEGLAQKYAGKGITVSSHLGTANDVGMEILRIAEQEAADLIVIATHGMSGWQQMVFGSVTEKIVRLASGPVLVLRAGSGEKCSSPSAKPRAAAVAD